MAKKVISVSLEEKTIEELDELAKKMHVSRSGLIEMTLNTTVGGQSVGSFTKWLFASIGDEERGSVENRVFV